MKSFVLYVLMIIALIVGFGVLPTKYVEYRAKQMRIERQAETAERQETKNSRIKQMEVQYDAVYFPPSDIDGESFTYKTQRFFKSHATDSIIFEGYLEDVVEKDGKLIAEFLRPYGGMIFPTDTCVRFRLTISEDEIAKLAKPKYRILGYRSFIAYNASYTVKAKILDTYKIDIYRFSGERGRTEEDEVKVETQFSIDIVAIGELLQLTKEKKGE